MQDLSWPRTWFSGWQPRAYVLGITGADPLRYDLLFERFLNEERISMPDIDIDFSR